MLLCIGMLVIPLVALGAGGGSPEAARAGRHATPVLIRVAGAVLPAPADPVTSSPAVASSTTVAPTTTPVTSHSGTVATRVHAVTYAGSVRSRPSSSVRSTASTAPPSTTTTTTAPPRPSQTGPASWYDAASGTCAHQTLPFGTVVSIVNLDTGATATCTVDDRGPYEDNRIIDLSPDVFRQLAPLSRGVINVRISW
jgi:rare lipoprotein A (peptidoglycan hydrolase)